MCWHPPQCTWLFVALTAGASGCNSQGGAGSNQCNSDGGGGCAPGCQYGAASGLPDSGGGPGPSGPVCGTTCLAPETPVQLANGEVKAASEISVGDNVLGLGGAEELVTRTFSSPQETLEILTSAGKLTCSTSHILLRPGQEQVRAAHLRLGEEILTSEGKPAEVRSIRPLGESMVYGWTCRPSHIFQAGSFIHHNKQNAPEDTVTSQ